MGSITSNPRDVRVTARTGTPRIRMMHDDAPDTYTTTAYGFDRSVSARIRTVIPTMTHRDRSTRHTIVTRDGFTTDVRTGRDAPNVAPAARPVTAANADDLRNGDATWNGRPVTTKSDAPTGPMRRYATNPATGSRIIVDDNVNGGAITPRPVRLVSDGDARLPRPVRPTRTARPVAAPRADRPVTRTTTDDVTAFAAAHGITIPTGPAGRTIRTAIRDVIAHRASVAAYTTRD